MKEEWIDKLVEFDGNISKLAKFLKKDRSNLFREVKQATQKGYLKKVGKKYIINDLSKLLIELHGVQIRIPITSLSYGVIDLIESGKIECQGMKRNKGIKPEQTDIIFKEIPEFLIRITSQSIIFIQREEYPIRLSRSKENVDKMKLLIENKVRSKIPFLEKRLMIDLDDIDELRMNCDTGHYAFVSDMLAKTFVANNQKLKVYVNGELRSLIDLSEGKNYPHMEHLHPKHNTHDAKAWERFTEKLDTGEFDVDKLNQAINGLFLNQQQIGKEYGENIKLHLATLQEMNKTLKKIQEKLDNVKI